jgi:hypothetical protein
MSGNILDRTERFAQDHFINFVLSDSKKYAQAEPTGRSDRAHGQFALPHRAESGGKQ